MLISDRSASGKRNLIFQSPLPLLCTTIKQRRRIRVQSSPVLVPAAADTPHTLLSVGDYFTAFVSKCDFNLRMPSVSSMEKEKRKKARTRRRSEGTHAHTPALRDFQSPSRNLTIHLRVITGIKTNVTTAAQSEPFK